MICRERFAQHQGDDGGARRQRTVAGRGGRAGVVVVRRAHTAQVDLLQNADRTQGVDLGGREEDETLCVLAGDHRGAALGQKKVPRGGVFAERRQSSSTGSFPRNAVHEGRGRPENRR